jgi:dephospho-CoA kinase
MGQKNYVSRYGRRVIEFGLTGGIGSGKSTVGRMLVARGAVLVDADQIVRDLQRPGELVFDAMVARWGEEIVTEAGELDRAAVAGIVFSDDDELAALNAIVHPAVAEHTQATLDGLRDADVAVVHDIPLLVQPGGELLTSRDPAEWAGIIVVDTPTDLAIARVVAERGMSPADIQARMDAQATREDRRGQADFLIDNSSDLNHLEQEVERCWAWMQERMSS